MADNTDEQQRKKAVRLAKEALPALVREGLLPASIRTTLDDSDFAYLVQLAHNIKPQVRTPGGLVVRARPFLRRSLPYSDAELVGNTLYASQVLYLLRALLDLVNVVAATPPTVPDLAIGVNAVFASVPYDRRAALQALSTAAAGENLEEEHLFRFIGLLGPERLRARLEQAMLRLTRVAR